MEHKIEVTWTGRYPNKCSGTWIILIDGKNFPIPEELVNRNMGTNNNYPTWHFGEDWSEEWSYYDDGLECNTWLKQNSLWIKKGLESIGLLETFEYKDLISLYENIREQDFRHNSCGGCI